MKKVLIVLLVFYIAFTEFRWHQYRARFKDYEDVRYDAIIAVHYPERIPEHRAQTGQ